MRKHGLAQSNIELDIEQITESPDLYLVPLEKRNQLFKYFDTFTVVAFDPSFNSPIQKLQIAVILSLLEKYILLEKLENFIHTLKSKERFNFDSKDMLKLEEFMNRIVALPKYEGVRALYDLAKKEETQRCLFNFATQVLDWFDEKKDDFLQEENKDPQKAPGTTAPSEKDVKSQICHNFEVYSRAFSISIIYHTGNHEEKFTANLKKYCKYDRLNLHHYSLYIGYLIEEVLIFHKAFIITKRVFSDSKPICAICKTEIEITLSLQVYGLDQCYDLHVFHRQCLLLHLQKSTNNNILLRAIEEEKQGVASCPICKKKLTYMDKIRILGEKEYHRQKLIKAGRFNTEEKSKQRCCTIL